MANDQSSRFKRRIAIYQLQEIPDGSGGLITQWKYTKSAWAEITTLADSPWFDFSKKDNSVFYNVNIRYDKNIKHGDKISMGSLNMIITSVKHDISETMETNMVACEQIS
jgi:SPP1 family predicted phage head-tail adaptor